MWLTLVKAIFQVTCDTEFDDTHDDNMHLIYMMLWMQTNI